MQTPDDLDHSPWRGEFPHAPGLLYLNHAGVASIPRRAALAIQKVAWHTAHLGARDYPTLAAMQRETRRRCAALVQAPEERVAFVPNTSEGLSWVALGLTWRPGDEIVTTDQEFPSNIVPWLTLAQRHGVTVHQVPSRPDGAVVAADLLERVTPRTRLVAVSWVQFGSGAMVDLGQLGAALATSGALLVVDAIQGLGALPLAPDALGVDVAVADGHKWLLGPEGFGFMSFSAKALEQITPRILGWHSVANAGDYTTITTDLRPGARRFEAGTPNVLGAVGLGESLGLLLEVGMETVGRRVRGLSGHLARGLARLGCILHTPLAADGGPAAGIVVFSHPRVETAALHQVLSRAGVYHAQRGAGLRLAPHFYQTRPEMARVVALVAEGVEALGG